ncbi:TIGR02147 family protein [uncultured Fibrobacter sp.]|uniref:TIGR02147 family protein n=1 Tax=uncultured Fibrobacter sp. TaxID=261512 RepID=UPI0025EBB41F|nr:TIGR02147 family protein [uncultured Fibrobacter sp.]
MKPIEEYLDYRAYLSDYYAENKRCHAFTWREFAKNCGFVSPVYLKQVIEGRYSLSTKAVSRVVDGLRLVGYERDYFTCMVEFSHAKGELEKQASLSKMLLISKELSVTAVGLENLRFFESYLNPLLRELAPAQPGKRPMDLAKICKPQVSASEVSETLRYLTAAGFLLKDENGFYRETSKSVKLPDMGNLSATELQRQMGMLALRALDLPRDERNMTGLTLGMSEKCYAEVVRELAECRRRIVALVQCDSVVEKVYRLNMQLFPMTEKLGEHPPCHPEGQSPEESRPDCLHRCLNKTLPSPQRRKK